MNAHVPGEELRSTPLTPGQIRQREVPTTIWPGGVSPDAFRVFRERVADQVEALHAQITKQHRTIARLEAETQARRNGTLPGVPFAYDEDEIARHLTEQQQREATDEWHRQAAIQIIEDGRRQRDELVAEGVREAEEKVREWRSRTVDYTAGLEDAKRLLGHSDLTITLARASGESLLALATTVAEALRPIRDRVDSATASARVDLSDVYGAVSGRDSGRDNVYRSAAVAGAGT